MALLQNRRLVNAEPFRRLGDTTDMMQKHLESYLNRYVGDASFGQKTAIPDGYYPPYGFALPMKDGGEGLFTKTSGSGSVVATSRMATVKSFPVSNITGSGAVSSAGLLSFLWILSNLTGSGEVDASSDVKSFAFLGTGITGAGEIDNSSSFVGLVWLTLLADLAGAGQIDDLPMSLITTMIADLAGSGDISDADFKAFLIMASSLSGSGEIDGISHFHPLAVISSLLTGSGSIEETQLLYYSWFLSNITGSGTLTGTMKGWADMAAAITSAGEVVTAQACAAAVWNALAVSNNDAGTMGEKLNDAGSASNPWTEIIGDMTAGELLENIAKLTGNKVTKTGDVITIYEADGHTIWRQYNLASGGRVEV